MVKKWKPYVVSCAIALAVGGLEALVTMGKMDLARDEKMPPLSPPSFLFPIVWTVLFLFMGIGAAIVWKNRVYHYRNADRALAVYGLNLLMNFVWCLLFFNARAFLVSFLWLVALWAVIVIMIRAFYKVSHAAAYLQIPYLLWVAFAGYLNFAIWLLN